jgi:hypothetical protein
MTAEPAMRNQRRLITATARAAIVAPLVCALVFGAAGWSTSPYLWYVVASFPIIGLAVWIAFYLWLTQPFQNGSSTALIALEGPTAPEAVA